MLLLLLLPAFCTALPRLATTVPDTVPSIPSSVICSDLETQCLSQGKLIYEGNCYTPLERGSCAENEWLLMKADATSQGYCSPRPCALGEVPFQKSCLNEANARARLCRGGPVHFDPSGRPRCGVPALLAAYVRCSSSGSPLPSFSSSPFDKKTEVIVVRVVRPQGVLCGANDNSECVKEVVGSQPTPQLQSED